MIVTDFENIKRYYSMSDALRLCAEFAKNNDLVNFAPGSYAVAEGIKVNINDFECTDTPKRYLDSPEGSQTFCGGYEGHRKMVDIQLDLTGHEKCYVTDIKNGKSEIPYSEEKDVEWFSADKVPVFNEILMDTETLVILFPEDIHAPTIFDGRKIVKKAIFKISIDLF